MRAAAFKQIQAQERLAIHMRVCLWWFPALVSGCLGMPYHRVSLSQPKGAQERPRWGSMKVEPAVHRVISRPKSQLMHFQSRSAYAELFTSGGSRLCRILISAHARPHSLEPANIPMTNTHEQPNHPFSRCRPNCGIKRAGWVTKRRSSWACIGNPNPEQETIKGTHAPVGSLESLPYTIYALFSPCNEDSKGATLLWGRWVC